MSRPIPLQFLNAPDFVPPQANSRILPLTIMTAYYGGGVEGGVCDSQLPFRPASIRGHLRWWWRATCGAAYLDHAALRESEGKIWGATDQVSPVKIEVLRPQLGSAILAKRQESGRWVFEQPAYALFPAQSDVTRTIYKRGSFDLKLTYPEKFAADVDAALSAWITFGGLGARTRRGVGSLYSKDLLIPANGLSSICSPEADPAVRQWSVLRGGRLIVGQPMSWEQAWIKGVEALKAFRQNRNPGDGPNRPGRSRWPEPDAIRRARGERSGRHSQDVTHDNYYPRSAMGLPIVFHFKDAGDPQPDNMLVIDAHADRMASPVILKPVAIDANRAVPICLILNAPRLPRKLLLQRSGGPDLSVETGPFMTLRALADHFKRALGGQIQEL